MRYPLIAGNWKMYKNVAEAKAFATSLKSMYDDDETDVRVVICAPFIQLQTLVDEFKGTGIMVGAQNCHFENEGAYTGEISVGMLQEIGVQYCIVGHSERRQYFNELDEDVNKKLKALLDTEIIPILCVGEDLYQREHNYQNKLVAEQVRNALQDIPAEKARRVVVAYEPIWAIGTGKNATPYIAGQMADLIRNTLIDLYGDEIADEMIIQYGGSVKPENVSEIMDETEIDGALVGGASLDPEKFIKIIDF